MIFNIYYINFPKVYEIKMMLSNLVKTSKEIQNEISGGIDTELESKLGLNFLKLFQLGEVKAKAGMKADGSRKILETFEVKTTKSIVLSEVIKQANKVNGEFDKIDEGELVHINNIQLSLENEAELRIVKFINSGAFKDMFQATNGVDMNGLFNSMFKDYAYKIKGTNDKGENILIKIPLTFENEFESSYSIDDLFIGKVSVVGIYKGKIRIVSLKNSFQYFQELGQLQNAIIPKYNNDEEIQNSHYEMSENHTHYPFVSNDDGLEYHYIDLLAITQNLNPK